MYQRGKIQEESMYYEHKKHDGSLPLIGVNTFLPKEHAGEIATTIELIRSTPAEKAQQIDNVHTFQQARNSLSLVGAASAAIAASPERAIAPKGAPTGGGQGLSYLQATARDRKNIFAALMEAVKTHSLGQISHALYDVGGEYRRNM